MASGSIENVPRRRLALDEGAFAVMFAVDRELGYAGVKAYTAVAGNAAFVVCLFDLRTGTPVAVIEADALGQRRTGAASGVAAKHLARTGAQSLGIIGCGWQAEAQVDAIRAAVPSVERVVAYCRTAGEASRVLLEDGRRAWREPPRGRRAGHRRHGDDVPDPVLRGEWLREGTLVCAMGANRSQARELDNVVLERATFICCDSRENAQLESGDLIDPVAGGVLDWLEVHELQEVVAGTLAGRQTDADIVVFKSNGLAAWDVAIGVAVVERARERGVGREL